MGDDTAARLLLLSFLICPASRPAAHAHAARSMQSGLYQHALVLCCCNHLLLLQGGGQGVAHGRRPQCMGCR